MSSALHVSRRSSKSSSMGDSSTVGWEESVSIRGTALLRGVPVFHVMRMFGALMTNSEGGAQTYMLSTPTPAIEDFISHNWSTGRLEKFLTLAVHYNHSTAMLAGWVTGAAFAGLTFAGWLPASNHHTGDPLALSAVTSGTIVFFAVTVFLRDIQHAIHRWVPFFEPRTCFLDKACIHQTDPKLKKAGIMSLAGFLHGSENILLVYKQSYLRRLWTVYELASFIMLHNDCLASTRIKIVPTIWLLQWWGLAGGLALNSVVFCAFYFLTPDHIENVPHYVNGLLGIIVCSWGGYLIRQWQTHLGGIRDAIDEFSIRNAACKLESDRDAVQASVCTFMYYLGLVPTPKVCDSSLDVFDHMVREELPVCIMATVGEIGYNYPFIVSGAMRFVLNAMDSVVADILFEQPVPLIVAGFVVYSYTTLILFPLATALAVRVLSLRPKWRGVSEWFLIAVALMPGAGMWTAGWALHSIVQRTEGRTAYLALAALIGYCVLLGAYTFHVWHKNEASKIPTQRRPEDKEEMAEAKEDMVASEHENYLAGVMRAFI